MEMHGSIKNPHFKAAMFIAAFLVYLNNKNFERKTEMTNKLISIIITIYNREDFLAECLGSVKN